MITRFIHCLLLFFFFPGIVKAQNDNHPSSRKIKCRDDTTQLYALYVPEIDIPGSNRALLIFLDPAARGDIPVEMYHALSDEYKIIMAGSYNSRNFNGRSSVESFVAVYNDIIRQYSIDPGRIWIAGFSGGARAAASIAMNYPEINAVIACGAGFANDDEITSANIKAYAAIVGVRDMNYSELLDNSHYLDEKKINNILLTFDGGHSWPPSERLGLAVEWIMSQSKDNLLLPSGRGSLFSASVNNRLDSGFLYAAWADAQQLGKIPAYKKTADSLLKTIESRKQFTADRENFRQAILEEQDCMNEFSMTFSKLIGQQAAGDKNDWIRKARLITVMKRDSNHYRRLAAERCFDHCTRTCLEYYFKLFHEADHEMAFSVAEILSFLDPENPESYYCMARAKAATGNKKQCEKWLEEAIRRGLVFNNRISRDTVLYKVLTKEEMEILFDKN